MDQDLQTSIFFTYITKKIRFTQVIIFNQFPGSHGVDFRIFKTSRLMPNKLGLATKKTEGAFTVKDIFIILEINIIGEGSLVHRHTSVVLDLKNRANELGKMEKLLF